jgi:hypothetical protein
MVPDLMELFFALELYPYYHPWQYKETGMRQENLFGYPLYRIEKERHP